jgi:sarcosine oxidase subunit gamma
VADPRSRRSALAAIYREGSFGASGRGVTLAERRPLAMVQIAVWPDAVANIRGALGTRLGLVLPGRPNTATASATTSLLWLGPERWLAVSPDSAAGELYASLAEACGTHAAVTDLGHARTCLRLSGARVRDLLAKGVGIDLHPRAFPPGACAQTLLPHVTVLLHAAEESTIDLYVARSTAQHIWEWLTDAAAEFGYEVLAPY